MKGFALLLAPAGGGPAIHFRPDAVHLRVDGKRRISGVRNALTGRYEPVPVFAFAKAKVVRFK